MQKKEFAGIITIVLLVFSMFYVLPVKAQNILRVGVIGPVGWIQGQSMFEGAELARDWINGPGGGIVIDGTRYDVSLHFGDEHAADMRPDLGALEMVRLVTEEQCDTILGGFRGENVFAMREVAMDYDKLFFICGAAADELVDCGTGTCGACVRCDYNRYRYLFRVAPVNQTTLLLNLLGFLSGYVLPYRLAPLYGSPVNTAVIAEDLDWTVDKYNALVYGGALGPHANIVYAARTPWDATDFSTLLDAMHVLEVRLIVHLFSAPSSIYFISQWAAHPIKAVPVGIDVLGQISDFWGITGGGCQYETFLASSGTRTPVNEFSEPYTTVEFWDLYWYWFDHAPIYTSFGVYDTIIALHDMLETAGIHPPFDQAEADALVPIIEQTYRESILGKFKYTASHPMSDSEYATYTITVGPYAGQTYREVNPPRWQSPLGQYFDDDGSGNVTIGDTRVIDVIVFTASWENGTYRDNDCNGRVTVCDTRLTNVTVSTASWESGTYRDNDGSGNVTIGDTRVIDVIVSTASWENGTYRDNDGSGNVTIGDTRLTDVRVVGTTYLAHTHVEKGNYDMGIDLTADPPTTYLAHTHVQECNYDIGDPLEWIRLPGALHDVFSNQYGPTWPCKLAQYVRPLVVQWQAGRLEVIWPNNQPYSKVWALPDEAGSMYPYPTDVIQVPPYYGQIEIFDALMIRFAAGTVPGDPTWMFVADVRPDNIIDMRDLGDLRVDFGKTVTLPLAYCDEAGHMH